MIYNTACIIYHICYDMQLLHRAVTNKVCVLGGWNRSSKNLSAVCAAPPPDAAAAAAKAWPRVGV